MLRGAVRLLADTAGAIMAAAGAAPPPPGVSPAGEAGSLVTVLFAAAAKEAGQACCYLCTVLAFIAHASLGPGA